MHTHKNAETGLTLVEALVSLAIVTVLLVTATEGILNSRFLGSYSRHQVQAMYAAQQILEQYRRQPFSTVSLNTSGPVILDFNGDFSNTGTYLYGTAFISVVNIDPDRDKINVEVDWQEKMQDNKNVTMKEYYSTIIVNDPVPN
ncbi:MAG: type II secretion system protein [Candidatus Omnitrophica bacterium]|nr:type II secretion system protein [Candidatus Omnitrophota bacterium]